MGTAGEEVLFLVGATGPQLEAHVGSANRMCLTRDDTSGVFDLGSVVNWRGAPLPACGSPLSLTRPAAPPFQSAAGAAGPSDPLTHGHRAGVPSDMSRKGPWGEIAPYGMVFGRQTVIYAGDGGPPRLGPRLVPDLGRNSSEPVQLTGERFVRTVSRVAPADLPAQRADGQGSAPFRMSIPRHPESAFPCFGYPPITSVREERSQNAALPTAVQAGHNPTATERTTGSKQHGPAGPFLQSPVPSGLIGSHRISATRSHHADPIPPVVLRRVGEYQTPEFLESEPTRPQLVYHIEQVDFPRGLVERLGYRPTDTVLRSIEE